MFTVIETPSFSRLCTDYWSENDRQNFASWIAANPEAGDVIPGSGGCRKVRWTRRGMGKRGGVRVIYYNMLESGRISFWPLRRLYMPMNEQELLKRDAKRDIGAELLASVQEMQAGKVGKIHHISVPEIVEVRNKSGMSQSQFASALGVSIRTLQEWEQGRRKPSGPAKSLLTIASKRPDVIREIFA